MTPRFPTDQVYRYLPPMEIDQLKNDTQCDVVIVGGGMAGICAAQKFKEKGCSVILIEKSFCGAGATGKSSGFITPDSEIPLHALIERFGKEKAKSMWEFVQTGVDTIKNNIETHNIDCDYRIEDTLVLASSSKDFETMVKAEHEARLSCGYDSTLYEQDQLTRVTNAQGFYGAVHYGKSFGIDGFRYAQGQKKVLQDAGIRIYEETPAIKLEPNRVITPYGAIKATYVVLCTDRFMPELDKLTYDIFPLQTFLMISAPLTDTEVKNIFTQAPMMAWDTALIYTYWRMTGDNRLMLGGSTLLGTYAGYAQHDNVGGYNRLADYFKKRFPGVKTQFDYMWPGLIGVSKDILPLAGRDAHDDSLYYVGACAGLPWAAALGRYAADALIDGRSDHDDCFSPYRSFKFGKTVQTILGNRLTFALSHVTTLNSF
ncbi:MAG: NAD(P)/FAD-dependent oxidoreductase [Candidatus Babeliales bacterium]